MTWETVIGLEVHAQLKTQSKIFSAASTQFGAEPNTQACAVDLALPGVLPVLNRAAVQQAIKFGLAVGAKINRYSIFARKNYFYPDLPKGYQISQFESPIVEGGFVLLRLPDREKSVRLTRAHLEEDAGKSLHEDFHGATGVDLNRAGTPLLEIVSEPDMRSAEEAVAYAKTLHALVTFLDICDGNMQEGSFRCDANVSLRKFGDPKLGTRCEIKNLNSFRFLERAIEYEVARQKEVLEDGGVIVQQTRLYDPDKDETRAMRTKEDAHDYRYFPDPDLLPLEVSDEWIDETRARLPELPQAKSERYMRELELSAYDAGILTASRGIANYFEATLARLPDQPKLIANWLIGELSAKLNRENLEIVASPIGSGQVAGLLRRIADGTLSGKIAKDVFNAMWEQEEGGEADAIIAKKGLQQISDSDELEAIVDRIIAASPAQVAEYRAGKEKVFGFFVGQAMKSTQGKANPEQLTEVFKRKLKNE